MSAALTRRRWLSWLAASVAAPRALSAAAGASSAEASGASSNGSLLSALPFERIELGFDGKRFGRRCFAFLPKRVAPGQKLRTLLLFHGLAETESVELGIRAYAERYGLLDAYARLMSPPVVRSMPGKDYLSEARLMELNRELIQQPFGDLAIVCPYTPNPYKDTRAAPMLDAYASFVERTLRPAALAQLPLCSEPAAWGVDGVSLGGYVSLEVFLRRPELFGSVGSTQGAFGLGLADLYARRIGEAVARVGARRFHFSTSSYDPSRASAERLAARLNEQGIAATFRLSAGPHDQNWLREVGCLELLLFQDRALSCA